jgi:hypothetical protein
LYKICFFCFLCSADEDPKRDAATAPSAEDTTADEPLVQEAEPAVKSPKAPKATIKKVPVARSTKRSKKSKEADVPLEAHEFADSPDDVNYCLYLSFLCDPYIHMFFP